MKQHLHRLSLVTAVLTFGLLLVGGIVHGTGSSLACPDWPLCFGEVFPTMTGGVFYEHSHRLFASLIGVLTIAITVLSRKDRARGATLGWLGPLALVMVVVQGVLGGLTVIYKLPTLVSTAHLGLSMIFFATIVLIAWRTRPESVATPAPVSAGLRRFVGVTAAAVYLQVVLGGLVRHTGGGRACGVDFPLCQDKLLAGLHPTAQVQMIHRIFAVLVSLLVLVAAVRVYRAARGHGFVRALAVLAPVLLAVQVTLGYLSVVSFLGLWQVTAHLGGGALMIANLWLLWLSLRPAVDVPGAVARAGAHTAGAERSLVEARS